MGKRSSGNNRRESIHRRGPAAAGMLIFFSLLLAAVLGYAQIQERFPKPDFQTDYTRPDLSTPLPRAQVWEYVDIAVLIAALVLASYFAHRLRSRRKIFWLMVFSLVYFGFIRQGCVCAVGAVQNVAYALFNTGYAIPLSVIAFFVLPLVFTLFYGRTFCAAVCPLGAAQDAVILKPVRLSSTTAGLLGMLPVIYLGLAVLFAATGTGFIICRYDPFIGFFRFGASFAMVLFGAAVLLLGTVVARPYCRFLCPLGVLLDWMSLLSKKHVKITPDTCSNCRLCEESCPFGAIHKPNPSAQSPDKQTELRRLAVLLVLLPVIMFGAGWAGSRLYVPLARQHPTVALSEEILLENGGERAVMTDATRAFRASGKTADELFEEAGRIQQRFRTGGWLLGGFIGIVFVFKLIGLTILRRRPEYEIDAGACFSCGRCFSFCPYEQLRLGTITREELEEMERQGKNGSGAGGTSPMENNQNG